MKQFFVNMLEGQLTHKQIIVFTLGLAASVAAVLLTADPSLLHRL